MRVLVSIITFLILGGSTVFGQTTASRSMSRSRTASRSPSKSLSASRTQSISRTASITPSISRTASSTSSASLSLSASSTPSTSRSASASITPSTSIIAASVTPTQNEWLHSDNSEHVVFHRRLWPLRRCMHFQRAVRCGFGLLHEVWARSSTVLCGRRTVGRGLLRDAARDNCPNCNFGLCVGDCDVDSDCAPGLSCFQRDAGMPVPGCSGTAVDAKDYCYFKELNVTNDNCGAAYNFKACQGDCDTDAECGWPASGLKCFQRNGVESTTTTPTGTPSPTGMPSPAASQSPTVSQSHTASQSPFSMPSPDATPTLTTSYILTTLSTQCSTGGCGHCEGACTSNAQCAAGLVCFTRSGLEAVPFCAGEGQSGVGYCVRADTSDPAMFYDAARENCPNCNFGLCVGDCDVDSDCAPGLSCFQRDAGMPVPGCSGTAVDAKDYCYFKELNVTNDNCGAACIFKACQGDCDTDAECGWPASGLKCFQRNGVESVPGCYGTGVSAKDYCYNPYLQTTTTPTAPPPPPPGAFRFGVAGDFGLSPRFNSLVDLAAISALDFFVATGDLSYTTGGEATWCSYWQQKGIYKLLLLAGNHDTGESAGGNIDQYIANCRNDLSSAVSDLSLYGKRYYVDFPVAAPMVRIIFVTPGVTGFNYTRDAVLAAKAQGIKWIIVAMHKNFISVQTKSNELGSDFIPMLFQNGVDLILQGHEHGYERTKQITCAVVNSYDANCVVDADNVMVKGSGTVIAVVGTGGVDLRTMDPADPEWGYFASVAVSKYGFGMVTVTQSQLEFQFIRSSDSGSLNDSFVIQDPVGRRRTASLGMQDQNTGYGYTHKVSATTTKRRASAAVSGRLSRAGLRPSV
eukprot:g69710.t1